VRNSQELWRTYQAASEWHKRPSEVIGILEESMEQDGGFTAYCFDEAVHYFGSYVTTAVEQAKGKTEQQRKGAAENILRKYLGMPTKFRDIGELGRHKVDASARPDPPFPMET